MKKICTLILLASALFMLAAPIVKNGEKIAFVGDSCTLFGNRPDGFIHLVMNGLKREGVEAVCIPAGVSGDISTSILARIDKVLAEKPDIVILKCGTNDVGWGIKGVKLPDFKINMGKILDKCQDAGARVVLVTPTMHREDPSTEYNRMLVKYCDFLREEVLKRKLLLADWNEHMHEQLAKDDNPGEKDMKLTIDKLHFNGYGNRYVAETILVTLGIPETTVKSYEKEWNKIPSMAPILNSWDDPQYKISINEYEKLFHEAKRREMTVDKLVKKIIADYINTLK